MPAVCPGDTTFRFPVRVYYEDTDTAGVVYYANYLKFFERARTEWLRTLGFGQTEMAELDGKVFIVRRASTDYRLPARLDDALVIHSQLSRLGRASLEFRQWCQRDDDVLASGHIQIGCVQRATLRPAAMPGRIAQRLAAVVTPDAPGSQQPFTPPSTPPLT